MAELPATPSPGPALREYAEGELADALVALADAPDPREEAPEPPDTRIHDGLHRARKAIRRTRAALSLADAALGPGARLIDRALRRLNKRSSWQRDVHALVQTLDRLHDRPQSHDARALFAHARDAASERRASLTNDAKFIDAVATLRAEVVVLRAALAGLPWDAVESRHIEAAIDKATRKSDKARERARHGDDAEDWHRWRRRMRRRSQQVRAAAAAGFSAVLPPLDKSIAEQLGLMQDLSLVAEHGPPSLHHHATSALERQRKRVRSVLPDA